MKKHLVVSLHDTLFYLNSTWVIPLMFAMMDVKKVAFNWRIMMNPRDIKVKDISKSVFKYYH